MDAKEYLLLFNIIITIVILAGLGVVIAGIIKKKKSLLAIGVLIALLPTIIMYFLK